MEIAVVNALHQLLAVFWVGGMLFAYACLRPAAGALEPPARTGLWNATLRRFLGGVWIAAAGLPLTGYHLGGRLFGGMAGWPGYVHLMHGLGWLMIALFLYLWFGPRRRLAAAVATGDTPAAGAALGQVRRVVAVNLGLGLIVVAAGSSGGYWG